MALQSRDCRLPYVFAGTAATRAIYTGVTPFAIDYLNNPNKKKIKNRYRYRKKFPIIDSQDLEVGKFLRGQGRREGGGGGGGIGSGNETNSN